MKRANYSTCKNAGLKPTTGNNNTNAGITFA
jgi:hypothetical protein